MPDRVSGGREDETLDRDARLRLALDALIDPHVLLQAVRDADGEVVDFVFIEANEAACAAHHAARDELIGASMLAALPDQIGPLLLVSYAQLVASGEPLVVDDLEVRAVRPPHDRRVDVRGVRIGDTISCTWRDMTERHEVAERYRLLAENASDVVFLVAPDGTYTWVSPSVHEVLGWDPEDLVGRTAAAFVPAEDLTRVTSAMTDGADGARTMDELRFRRADGTYLWMSGRAREVTDGSGVVVALVVALRDVHEQVLANHARGEVEARYLMLAQHALDVVFEADADSVIRWISPSVERVLGWTPQQLVGTRAVDLVDPDEVEVSDELRQRAFAGEAVGTIERRVRRVDGELRWMSVQTQPIVGERGEVTGLVVGWRDCQVEVLARRAAEARAAITASLVRATDEAALLEEMCQIAVDVGGYALSWYGRRETDPPGSVTKVAWSQDHRDYLDAIEVSWGDGPLARGPAGRSIRTGRTVVVGDLQAETSFEPWVREATARGFRATISLPVRVDGMIDGAFIVYALERDAFNDDAVAVLEDLASQLGFGLKRLREAERLGRSLADQALLLAAIEQVGESVVLTAPDQRIIYANPAAARSSGYALDELIGHPAPMLVDRLDDPTAVDGIDDRLAAGESWQGVLVNRRRNGEVYEEDTTIGPVHDDAGAVVAYVAVGRDLSAERRLEADLSREQRDRASIVGLMREVHPAATLDDTAARFCLAVCRLEGIDGAMVILEQPGGALVPFAVSGLEVPGSTLGASLPVDTASDLVAMSLAGSWTLDLGAPTTPALIGSELTDAMRASGITATGYVALRWDRALVGILAVATAGAAGPALMTEKLGVLDELGSFAGTLFGTQAADYGAIELARAQIQSVLDLACFHPVFQPVVDPVTHAVRGYEALTRFDSGEAPDLVFARAHGVGLGITLECACVAAALEAAGGLDPALWLSVNFSPAALLDGGAAKVLDGAIRPIVVEVTEHERIESYDAVRAALRGCGDIRVSVDDAGSGYASLRHILELEPDIVKLDIALVRDIDTDPARQALAAGLCHYAAQTGTTLIAEGVETRAEADAVVALGVHLAQGYFFGRPAPIA